MKIGEGSWSAWLRTGLGELRNMLYPDSNVAQQPEYGMYGTKTPGEVAEDRRDAEDTPSVLRSRLLEAEGRNDRSRGRDMER